MHCDYKATQRSQLRIHIQSIHDGKRYKCELCNKEYTSKGNLQAHKKSDHKTERKSTKYNIAKNELVLTSENSENKYVTSLQDSGFEDSSKIRTYAKNVDTNVIKIYENNSRSASNSEINSAVNSNFKFSCIFMHCDYKATQRSQLEIHIQSVHDGKRYQCEVCNKEYTDRTTLRRHKKSAHEDLTYKYDAQFT